MQPNSIPNEAMLTAIKKFSISSVILTLLNIIKLHMLTNQNIFDRES